MKPEQPLYYSTYCFGTADAISFKDGLLRIHDLKTGVTKPHMEQLLTYAALFCLEYRYDPFDISTILRIYQNNEIEEYQPTGDEIRYFMDKVIHDTKVLADHEENLEV